ncbi:hypothetical protein GCM10010251_00090 [Streptomyces aurantiogriseus]|uniref:Uncharacterized protein n=1 Tax=Streptomyces aurantiogriseus TaxID=66870 RepID=A0A918EYA6_9ACTN|nr:hypothetical protein GCM10010251_00090 [Streptomyces aurantiogriseus]
MTHENVFVERKSAREHHCGQIATRHPVVDGQGKHGAAATRGTHGVIRSVDRGWTLPKRCARGAGHHDLWDAGDTACVALLRNGGGRYSDAKEGNGGLINSVSAPWLAPPDTTEAAYGNPYAASDRPRGSGI